MPKSLSSKLPGLWLPRLRNKSRFSTINENVWRVPRKTLTRSLVMTVTIRVATPDDAQDILAIYAPYCTSSHVSFELVAPSELQMRERIERITPQFPWLVGEIDGKVSGYVYASQHRERPAYRWAVDVAVYIAAGSHRRGLGRALYASLFAILREQGFFQAYAGITLPNPGSEGLHQAVGFQQVAVFPHVGYKIGRWLDVGWWRLQLLPETDDPAEPIPFRLIRGSTAGAAIVADCMPSIRSE
jgi:L-amino acid N-acyltransferase YncA